MGWDYQHIEKPINRVELVMKDYTCENEVKIYQPLKGVAVGKVVYLAVEETDKVTNKKEVFAVVAETKVCSDYFNFGMKSNCETAGPCFYDCPASILDLLTPTSSEWANEWREKCRQNIQSKKEQINLSKCEIGTKILIQDPKTSSSVILEKYRPFNKKRAIWVDFSSNRYFPMSYLYQIGFELLNE